MTDYTKNVNYAVKDGLTTGNPNKAVLGTELDAEFDEIATSIATKANSSAPAFTGSATAVDLSVSGTLDVVSGGIEIATVAVTSSAAELNLLDGATATTTEINYLSGVTSAIQTQLDGKQATGAYLTGNQTITLSGDATGSGTTAITVTVDMGGLSGTTYAAGSGSSITNVDAASVDGYDVWVGTQASYDGLTPDANTLYFING